MITLINYRLNHAECHTLPDVPAMLSKLPEEGYCWIHSVRTANLLKT